MAELLKNVYNRAFISTWTTSLKAVLPAFDVQHFTDQVFDEDWDSKSLKQRMRHISTTLHAHLPGTYPEQADVICKTIAHLQTRGEREQTIEYMFFPDFIEVYGIDDLEPSVQAIEYITTFTSCEFAVRPFILRYEQPMMQKMLEWTQHPHPHVRRLATEGCRPRLPWAMALPPFKKDPSPVLPLLDNLKADPSEFVRRSVANNLNDIAKDHPETVKTIAKKWLGTSADTDRLVKHACRTLLKQGDPEVLQLFGFLPATATAVSAFDITTPNVKVGCSLAFQFTLTNKSDQEANIRLEYGLYYLKANGTLSKKVFNISEKRYAGGSTTHITRKQSFKPITTRTFYPGAHQLSLIINGEEVLTKPFNLIKE